MTPIKINAADMWQTTFLDYAVAEELFGWRWLTYLGRPVSSHPDYPIDNIPVRRFYPPDDELAESKGGKKRWADYFAAHPHTPATGEEPLAYCYESSMGPHEVPHFSGHEDAVRTMEKELHRRGLLERYKSIVAEIDDGPFPSCEDRCIAALAAVGSKYVTVGPQESDCE